MAQTGDIARRLGEALPDWKIELVKIRTKGDRDRARPLAAIGGEGLFTKELQQALLDGRIDVAVHSMKDLPTDRPDGLVIAAVPERVRPNDVLIARDAKSLDDLPEGAVLGTGSSRRKAQILDVRPDLVIEEIRGNVDTRIGKVRDGKYDATLLAWAGLHRLGLETEIAEVLSFDVMLPAPGQGALAVEMRDDDEDRSTVADILHHEPSASAVDAERGVLAGLGGGCHVPVAVLGEVDGGGVLHLRAVLAEDAGPGLRRAAGSGPVSEAGRVVASALRALRQSG